MMTECLPIAPPLLGLKPLTWCLLTNRPQLLVGKVYNVHNNDRAILYEVK